MITTLAIVSITFLLTIIDKFVIDKKTSQEVEKVNHNLLSRLIHILYRLIKSKYLLIIFLLVLLIFQVIEVIRTAKADKHRDITTSGTHIQVSKTYDKLLETNLSINNLLDSINSNLNITKKELLLISSVNEDIKNVRDGIEKNLLEFYSIKSQYEKQIEIEREKINQAKPNLNLVLPKSIVNSLTYAYQFRLENSGMRVADSIIYHSLMVFINSESGLFLIDLYKTNDDDANILRIEGKGTASNVSIFNSIERNRKELFAYDISFLLIKYRYVDNLTSKADSSIKILGDSPLDQGNRQFGHNVSKYYMELIKNGLYKKDKKRYFIFFQ